METVYQEFALLLFAAATVGLLAIRMRQPLILAYIVVGILVGPSALGWASAHEQIELLAQIGITVLLFVVGLKLDIHLVKNLGAVALATGLGQLAFTIFFGFLLALGFGMDFMTSLYVAIALTFSSTIIIVKLLSDKREIDSLHGRIAMGFLIVQDVAVVIAMMVVGSQNIGEELAWYTTTLMIIGKMALAVGAILILMRYVLPRLLHWVASSMELLLLFAVAWGTGLATLGEMLGFSKEIGAFLAGFSLASTPFRESISSRLSSLRDFLLLFFFLELGSKLDLGALGAQIPEAVVFSLFVLIGNPLIVMAIMGYMGYRKRTGFLAGLTVAQISEFSIIFVAMGITLGHVTEQALSLVTLVGLITIGLSTYMILYSQSLYEFIKNWIGFFERKNPQREMKIEMGHALPSDPEILIFGHGRYGRRLAKRLVEAGRRVLVIDFDPEVVRRGGNASFPVMFGDAEDAEFLASLPTGETRWVVSTMSQPEINIGLIKGLRAQGYLKEIAVVAHHEHDRKHLRGAGATRILMPFWEAADLTARKLDEDIGRGSSASVSNA
jgi:Kef-type K+ transport system membrane component KefB